MILLTTHLCNITLAQPRKNRAPLCAGHRFHTSMSHDDKKFCGMTQVWAPRITTARRNLSTHAEMLTPYARTPLNRSRSAFVVFDICRIPRRNRFIAFGGSLCSQESSYGRGEGV